MGSGVNYNSVDIDRLLSPNLKILSLHTHRPVAHKPDTVILNNKNSNALLLSFNNFT